MFFESESAGISIVLPDGQIATYRAYKLQKAIERIRGQEEKSESDVKLLKAMIRAERRYFFPLTSLNGRQHLWLKAWQVSRTQRYGQGMTLGALIHSELWCYLDRQEWEGCAGHEKQRAFDAVVKLDEIWRERELEKMAKERNKKQS